jgi:hypothetical protein
VIFLNCAVEPLRWLLRVLGSNKIMASAFHAKEPLFFGLGAKQLLLLLLELVDIDSATELPNVTKV